MSYPDLWTLIDACCEAIEKPEFKPTSNVTFCNLGVSYVAWKMGLLDFQGKTANQIIDHMITHPEHFRQIDLSEAQTEANSGKLVLAGQSELPHGHVCVVRPGNEGYSGNWVRPAPKVLNIGKINFISKGLNYSFSQIPLLWVWKPE